MIMAVSSIGGVSAATYAAPTGAAPGRAAAPADAAQRAEAQSKASTIVISRVTRTRDDGSTVTTVTYADGHIKLETTPPKFTAAESQGATESQGAQSTGGGATGTDAGGRITAVDILA
jgi:hypothetical protein